MTQELINYCVIAAVSLLFLIGCLAHLCENDVFSKHRIGKFRRLIYMLMFEVIIDCLFEILAFLGTPISVLYVIKACEMIINPTLIYLVFDIFYDKKRVKQDPIMQRLQKFILVTIAANAVLQLLAVFGLKTFSIDSNGQYHRETLVIAYVILLVIGVFAIMYGIFVFSRKTQSTMQVTMFSFATILFISIVLRALFADNNYDFLCMSVAIPFLLIYYSHLTLRVDPLTRLLNRNVYSRAVKNVNYTTIVIIVDANNFKRINDSFGHECGDQTLRQIGHAIFEAYGQYAYCYRIGGDEFCVVLKPDMFGKLIEETPHHDVYYMAEKLMDRLEIAIQSEKDKNSEEGFLDYGVSQGYGIYYSETDYPEIVNRMPFEKVVELADKRMYHNKERCKKAHPELEKTPEPDSARARVIYKPSDPEIIDSSAI